MSEERFRWRVWWLRDHPGKGVLLIFFLVIIPAVLWALFPEEPIYAVLSVLLLFGSFWMVLLPVDYEIQGGRLRWGLGPFQVERSLSEFRRVVPGREALWLSRYTREHWMDDFRGVLLRFPARERELRERVEQYLRRQVGVS